MLMNDGIYVGCFKWLNKYGTRVPEGYSIAPASTRDLTLLKTVKVRR